MSAECQLSIVVGQSMAHMLLKGSYRAGSVTWSSYDVKHLLKPIPHGTVLHTRGLDREQKGDYKLIDCMLSECINCQLWICFTRTSPSSVCECVVPLTPSLLPVFLNLRMKPSAFLSGEPELPRLLVPPLFSAPAVMGKLLCLSTLVGIGIVDTIRCESFFKRLCCHWRMTRGTCRSTERLPLEHPSSGEKKVLFGLNNNTFTSEKQT